MLSNKALLVSLTISQWVGRKLDRKATSTVETNHKTDHKAGNYTKKLLPGAKELDNIQKHAGSIRVWVYEQTLPWFSDGSRILSSKNYMEFTAEFRRRKASFDSAVSEFIQEYPLLRSKAQQSLGDLFNDADYPSEMYLQTAFACEIAFMPIPDVGDFRVQVLDEEKETFLKRMTQVENDAVKEVWTRLHDVVANAATKLQSPDAVFRDSLIENITDMCALLPKLNVTDDPNLETARQDVEKLVNSLSVDVIRAIPQVRNSAAEKLAELTSKMSVFMGN